MSNSKRSLSLSDVSDVSFKHSKTNDEKRNRYLGTLNESHNRDSDPNKCRNVSHNYSKRVSLSRKNGPRRSSLPIFDKTTEEQDSLYESPKYRATPEEYQTNLRSLYEILSRRFEPKKAFSYDFINIMHTFVNRDKDLYNTDYRIIAKALEAGIKLYGCKIDIVLRKAQKISSSLSMATEVDDVDEATLLDVLNNRSEKRRAKPQKKNANAIVTKPKTLNGKSDINIELDPMFHQLAAAYDVGNVNFLLMANLNTDPYGVMILDSNANLNFQEMSIPQEQSFIDVAKEPFKEKYISHYFENFDFLNRENGLKIQNSEEMFLHPTYTLDINAQVDDIHDMDNDHVINFENNFPLNVEESSIEGENGDQSRIDADIETQNLIRLLPTNDNQFFNKNFLKTVFKKMSRFNRPNINPNPANNARPRQRRRRVVYQANEYGLQFDGFEAIDGDNLRCSSTTLERWIAQSNTLRLKSLDHGFNPLELKKCFFEKNFHFRDLLKGLDSNQVNTNGNALEDDDNEADYAFFDDFDGPDAHSPINFNQAFEPLNLEQRADSGIDDEPMCVDALDIEYAKFSIKIDINRVKRGMWEAMVKESTDTQTLFSTQPSFSQASAQESTSSQSKTLTFCHLRHVLPKYISAGLNEQLNLPISFVALLHLCNEKSLNLTPQEQLKSDFCIEGQIPDRLKNAEGGV